MSESTLPLDGVRVIDFTSAMLGPSATLMLADYGADVIKIERPGTGDNMRTVAPDPDGLDNPLFLSLNRNKRSITLNLKSDLAKQIVFDLVRGADVVVSNYRARVMERLGFGYEELKAINPRIIWASGTAFGTEGPLAHKPGIDQLAQGMTGLMARRPNDDTPLSIYPGMICDYTGSMHLAMGILLALLARDKTGEGQKVEVSLYDSALGIQMMEASDWLQRQNDRNFARMPHNGVYATSDGHVLMMGVFRENALRDISIALELGEDLSERPEFATSELQFENMAELQRTYRERIATNTTAHWLKRFEEVDLMCSEVLTLGDALSHEQTAANGMVIEMDHPVAGTHRALGSPIHLSATPMRVRHPAPQLGAHIDDVLSELGVDGEQIAAWRGERVFA